MSFGICAIKFIDDVPHYLLIRRRDSLAYVEFMRGRYTLNNPQYIQLLIDNMSVDEQSRLLVRSFDDLWEKLWNGQNTRQYRNEYESAHIIFERLRNTGDVYGKLMASYLQDSSKKWSEPEWGFPKGRRTLHESELMCAIREFSEETGFPARTLQILHTHAPLVEEYTGTNGVAYKQVYYVGLCHTDLIAKHQPHNKVMSREVGNIGWFPYETATTLIRETNPEKRALLHTLHTTIVDRTPK